jgi:hypothetical protein
MGNRSTSAFQDARRVQIHASAAARMRRLQADEPSTGECHQSPHRKRSEAASFMCTLRGIRPRLACLSRQSVCRLAAERRSLPFTNVVSGGEKALGLRSHTALRPQQSPARQPLQRPSCGLTLRSAPTRYGRPACPCGALVYAAPHGQAVPPPRSVSAQTLGLTIGAADSTSYEGRHNMTLYRRISLMAIVANAFVFAPSALASPIDICNAMSQAIAPGSGATLTNEQSLGEAGGVMKIYRLSEPLSIGGASVDSLWELGGTVRAVFRFPDAAAAAEFGKNLAKQYGQNAMSGSSDRTIFRTSSAAPFESVTTSLRGRTVQFYCTFERRARSQSSQ